MRVLGKKDFTAVEKYSLLLRMAKIDPSMKLRAKAAEKKIICGEYGCHMRSYESWAKSYREQREKGILVPDLDNKRVGKCGRKLQLTAHVKNRIFKANTETEGRTTISQLFMKDSRKGCPTRHFGDIRRN